MHHATKYCNCTVRQGTACIHSSPDPSLFVEVGLACKTKYNAGGGKSTSIVLAILQHKAFIYPSSKQTFNTKILAFLWLGLGMRLVDNKIK